MIDKISKNSDTVSNNNDSLIFWMNRYFSHEVFGEKYPQHTYNKKLFAYMDLTILEQTPYR